MKKIVQKFIHDREVLIETTLEILNSKEQIKLLKLAEDDITSIISDMYTELEKDLAQVHRKRRNRSILGQYLLKIQKENNLSLDQQYLCISVIREVLYWWLIKLNFSSAQKLHANISLYNKIIDRAQISINHYWYDIYQKKHINDQNLIQQLKIVKDDLQVDLNLIYKLIKGLPVGIISCDKNFNILHWNPMASKLTGYKQADIYKQNLLKIFTPASKNKLLNRLQKSKKAVENLRSSIQCKSGETLPTIISLNKLDYIYEGNIAYIISFLNIKDQEIIHSQTEKIDQLNAIAVLSGSIMHDIRNPINSIGLNIDVIAQLLGEKGLKVSKIDTIIKTIYSQIEQLKYNLHQYLGYARLAEINPRPMDLSARLLDLILEMRIHSSSKNIQILYNNSLEQLTILGDWSQLRRVFVNIIQNSMDVIKENGSILVKLLKRKKRILVTIEDSGKGISGDTIKKIFNPYFSTKETGTGLGLFIAKEIVNVHHGRITCKNSPNRGAKFTISFPLHIAK
jgi:PAS domain S-box-containing protein